MADPILYSIDGEGLEDEGPFEKAELRAKLRFYHDEHGEAPTLRLAVQELKPGGTVGRRSTSQLPR